MNARVLLLLAAVVCFALAAFEFAVGGPNLVPLGLAFLAGAFLVID